MIHPERGSVNSSILPWQRGSDQGRWIMKKLILALAISFIASVVFAPVIYAEMSK
jgi:hypothetical protein